MISHKQKRPRIGALWLVLFTFAFAVPAKRAVAGNGPFFDEGWGLSPSVDLGLNCGTDLILDVDGDSSERIVCSAGNSINTYTAFTLRSYFGGTLRSYAQTNQIVFYDDYKLTLGASLDYWSVYNSTGLAYEFWSTNVDGGGADGIVWYVLDGADDVNFSGGLNLNVGSRITFDADGTADDYISAGADNNVSVYAAGTMAFQWATNLLAIPAAGQLRLRDTASLQFGTAADQSLAYTDGTGVTWSDGTNTVLTIPDDSNQVVFGGDVSLNVGQKLVFDGDGTANDYIYSFADGNMSMYIGGGEKLRIAPTRIYNYTNSTHTNNNRIYLGSGENYWHVYNSIGTAYEFWANDADGGGTDGIVWSVQNGTDVLNVPGVLNLGNADGGSPVASRRLLLGNGEQLGSDVYSGAYLGWTSGNASLRGNGQVELQNSVFIADSDSIKAKVGLWLGHIVIDCDDDGYSVPATAAYITVDTGTGTCTGNMDVTLPAAACTATAQAACRVIGVKRLGAVQVDIGGAGGTETIDGSTTYSLTAANQAVELRDTNITATDWGVW